MTQKASDATRRHDAQQWSIYPILYFDADWENQIHRNFDLNIQLVKADTSSLDKM